MKLLLIVVIGGFFSSFHVCFGKNSTNKMGDLRTFSSFSKPTLPTITLPTFPTISLPTLPTLPTKPSLTGLSNLFPSDSFGNFNLFQTLDSLLNMKNQIPNALATFGNFSLLQATLLLALGGVVVGVAVLVAEAWSFKKQEDQEYYYHNRVPHYDVYSSPVAGQYGAPPAPSYGGYGSNNRQSYVPQTPMNYNNYKINRQAVDRLQSLSDGSKSALRFPTFDRNRKKKIMFG